MARGSAELQSHLHQLVRDNALLKRAVGIQAGRMAELEREAIMDGEPGPFALYIDKADLPAVTAGALLSTLSNPITRTPVKVTGGDTWDWFEVRRPVPYKLLEPADTIPA